MARQFEPGEVRVKDGLRLTRVALALIDLAVEASERELRFAFLEACRLGLFGHRDVAYCYRRVLGRRGAKKLRPLLSLWVPELKRIRSVLEGLFLLAWVERGFDRPKVNEKVHGYEVDAYWPDHGFVLELDGAGFHSDPMARSADLAKQRHLESKGLRVRRLGYQQVAPDPAAAVDRIARELGLV
ncbi:MAG: DUF559 domain-containing protein [Solirubrobacterales bacterium]|nr:DUF559 domain-containing protein [Solirubrobacterales bacterium]